MRLDKFLKVSRIIKRRTVANSVCDAGRATINGRPAKAGSELKVGDILTIGYGRRRLEVEIVALAETIRAEEADSLYRVISDVRSGPEPDIRDMMDDF